MSAIAQGRTPLGNVPRFQGGLHEVAENTFAWLQPNGGLGESNAGLIVGDGESLLVDSLWTLPLTRQMLDAFAAPAAGAPIRRLVNTHSDGDHFWGNQIVGAREIISTRAAAARMHDENPKALAAMGAAGRRMKALSRRPLPVPGGRAVQGLASFTGMLGAFDFRGIELTPPTLTFDGSLELDVGGRAVHLIEVGPAHTEGDAIVHVPDARVVFAADVMFEGVTPVMWVGPASNWREALDRIILLDPEKVVPGHGPVTDLDGVRRVREYWEFVEDAARTQRSAGRSVEYAALAIARSQEFISGGYGAWEEPGRLLVNVAMLYRRFAGLSGRVSEAERAKLLAGMPRVARAARGG